MNALRNLHEARKCLVNEWKYKPEKVCEMTNEEVIKEGRKLVKYAASTLVTITVLSMLSITAVMESHAQLNDYELVRINIWSNGTAIVINDIEPSINSTLKKEINRVLKDYRYTYEYEKYKFDCSDRSIITCDLLKSHGMDARLMFKPHKDGAHMWIVVFDWAKYGVFIECSDVEDKLGHIVAGNSENFEYDSGWVLNSTQQYIDEFADVEASSIMQTGADYRHYLQPAAES